MSSLDFDAMEQQARLLRAEAIRQIQDLVFARLCRVGRLTAAALLAGLKLVSEILRPLFSWNPQPASRRHAAGPDAARPS